MSGNPHANQKTETWDQQADERGQGDQKANERKFHENRMGGYWWVDERKH